MFASSIKREIEKFQPCSSGVIIGNAKADFNAQAWNAKLPLASSRSRLAHVPKQRVLYRLGNFTT